VPDYFRFEDQQTKDMSMEEKSRLYIRQKKYREAIEILKQLNLINPKKSIYFADQIRFLERIIANSK
ncbi:MAG: tetratricopeptide repeat protein, partial [Paludibacter sp.]|nr:tetratricopeptide repeat protein [Paludibacter sp.]